MLRKPNMAPQSQRLAKKRDRSGENFTKATKSLLARCDRLRERYKADIYIQVRRMHRHYTYTSSNEPSWPKTKAEMERMYPVPVTRTPQDFDSKRNRVSSIHTLQESAAEEKTPHVAVRESSHVDCRNVLALNHEEDAYPCDKPVGQETMSPGEHSTRCMENHSEEVIAQKMDVAKLAS
ncbi:hypothetical protein CABS01_16590 [Colletotrichum abscissum]|uniref:Uncharacterized protein n=1 Tax=Colletotrichum tamarilloi TaxID=1209934 RepID=A0ABQ9QI67_9PEZI|nr:uncharacterized protein CTAM01_16569 [Colletotrichum tamarilloi]XP_060404950.1 uncharacterized protein CABS01_16590 [Colletotrichum abscissum]KAK1471352.1 hypothetical protein CTAM01_16569 [Colletotrichum tamarilloi]KAK1519306.1 hypothetical protein CABS01_16590 [Colletotrichum abscissum]